VAWCGVLAMQAHSRTCCTRSTRDVVHAAAADQAAAVRDVAFDAAGRLLLAGGDDKCARVWDAATWRLLQTWCAQRLRRSMYGRALPTARHGGRRLGAPGRRAPPAAAGRRPRR